MNQSQVILDLLAICVVPCESAPFLSIFQVFLSHSELTISVYFNVVAIVKVSNTDATIMVYLNASDEWYPTIIIEFSVDLAAAHHVCVGFEWCVESAEA